MPHMLAQQHLGHYDAVRAGTARTQATIAAALAAIGSTPTILVLSLTGDGIWTLSSSFSSNANVTILIPPGVTVTGAGGITWTCNGPILAGRSDWKTGGWTLVRGLSTAPEMSALTLSHLTVVPTAAPNGVLVASSPAATAKRVRLFTDQGGGNVGIAMSQDETNNASSWQNAVVIGGGLTWARPGSTYIMQLNDNGLGIGGSITPSTWLLQVAGDGTTNSAAKPTGGSWSNSASDLRVKDPATLRDYPRGLAFVRSLPKIKYYQYNGKAGTPVTGKDCVGFIADDLEPVVPEWVFTYPAKLEPNDPAPVDLKGLNDSELIYSLLNAVKELDVRLTAVETPGPGATAAAESGAGPAGHAQAKTASRRRAH